MNVGSPAGLRWRPLDALSWDEAADAFNRCYEGYVIPVRASGADLAARCRAEDVDASASYVIDDGSDLLATGLIARRATRARLAAFAVAPHARGKGVARPALARLLGESEARGDAALELEVFEHNLPAVRLYERASFVATDRLLGFEFDAASVEAAIPGANAPELQTLPIADLAALLATDTENGLPWQLESETVARMGDPWQLVGDGGGALALVDFSRPDAVNLRLMFTPGAQRRTGRARGLFAAIVARAAGRPIRVPQLIPERNLAFARALGFKQAEHSQLRMVRTNARA